MREIKFKVWNREHKKFTKDGWLGHYDDLYVNDLEEIFNSDSEIFLQYTGLKDKNGKEIYEGDLVLTNGKTALIVWDRFAWFLSSNGRSEFVDATGQEHEVIGNMYENANLIN